MSRVITALQAEIVTLKAALSKFQESSFNPDWSLLQASKESLRENIKIVKELQAKESEQEQIIIDLKAQLAELETALSNAKTEIKTLGNRVDDLSTKLSRSEHEKAVALNKRFVPENNWNITQIISGFISDKNNAQNATPNVLVNFSINDWTSRDSFARDHVPTAAETNGLSTVRDEGDTRQGHEIIADLVSAHKEISTLQTSLEQEKKENTELKARLMSLESGLYEINRLLN